LSQVKNNSTPSSPGHRKNLKKRSLWDEFSRGTVKSRLIVIFTLFITQVLALVALLFVVQKDMAGAGLDPFTWKMSISLALLLSIIVLFFYLRRTITRNLLFPLRRMVERMVELTDSLANGRGNFTTRIDIFKKDEIGELRGYYNRLLELLQTMLQKVKKGSHDVYGLTEHIKNGSEELAGHTEEQTASIQETTQTLEQFTQVVRDNSRHAEEVGAAILSFNRQVLENRSLIDQVTSTMQEIDESSRKIDNIISVINDISFQTNLLALNAAVEAARAGEAGRGFAVVAAEVRNLAQKTAESSKVIREIVTRNVEGTRKGMELVSANSRFFTDIITMMQGIEGKIGQITDGSRQQTQGIDGINSAIGRLEQIMIQNTSLVQSFTSTAQEMQASSSDLMVMVDNFEV
jgi:methyl-accepting chemotaxis protein